MKRTAIPIALGAIALALLSASDRSDGVRWHAAAGLLVLAFAGAWWGERVAVRRMEACAAERARQLELEREERRRVAEAYVETEQLLKSLLENLPVHIFRKDREGRLTFVNRQFCEFRGRTAEELIGRTAADLLPPDQAERQAQADEAAMASGRAHEAVDELVDGAGQRRHVHGIKVPVFDGAGRCIGVQGMLLDVTERERAKVRLAEAGALLDTMLMNLPDYIYFKDRESRFVRFSRSMLRRFGLDDPARMIGRSDEDFFGEAHAKAAREDEREILRTGRPIVGKLEQETLPDGSIRWALTTKMPWRDAAGAMVGTFGISRDITDLKQAEDRLAYERDLLRTLLDSSPDTIYFKDLQSRFVRVSRSKVKGTLENVPDVPARRAARNLRLDVPFEELLGGLSDFDLYEDHDASVAFEDEQQVLRTGEPLVGKMERQAYLNGEVRWRMTSKMPWRDSSGQLVGTLGISKDITDLKRAEEKLEKIHRQLVEASRQAGMAEVATGVLHNVGNVLNSLNVSATLVAERFQQSRAGHISRLAAIFEEHREDLAVFLTDDTRGRMIPEYLGSLARLISEERGAALAELDRLRAHIEHIKEIVATQQAYARTVGVVESIPVVEVIEDALRINAGSLSRHEVELRRDYQARPVVTTDKHRVMQILINLVRNAKYACDESGRPDKEITVHTTADAQHVRIAVVDNGVGIAPENLTRVFNHGFTTRKNGHGFGLHTAALAAKELGGSLAGFSDGPGRGATFVLEIPLRREEAAA